MIEFRIDLVPRGQGRARATSRGRFASVYKHDDDVAAESSFAALASRHRPAELLQGPLRVRILAVLPRPAALCGLSKRTGDPLQDPGRRWHTAKPDSDNCIKLCLDSLKSFWKDDAQVSEVALAKHIAALNEPPHWMVKIEQLPELDSGWRPAEKPLSVKARKLAAKTAANVAAVKLADDLF